MYSLELEKSLSWLSVESVATIVLGVLHWKLSPICFFDYLSVVGIDVRLTVVFGDSSREPCRYLPHSSSCFF